MKILFLDIDGVANCKTTGQQHRGVIGIDPYKAFLIGKILDQTDAVMVLSSTWRLWKDSRDEVEKQIATIFNCTPQFTGRPRGEEIDSWLKNASWKIERYAILDDDSDMLPNQLSNFFKTSWETGLTDEIAEKVIKHLNQ